MEKAGNNNTYCVKHQDFEYSIFCPQCKALLCVDCCLEHDLVNHTHKTCGISELLVDTVKKMEKEKENFGSLDVMNQQLKSIEAGLDNKIKESSAIAKQVKEKIINELDKCVTSQLSEANAMMEECQKIKELLLRKSEDKSKLSTRIINLKKSYAQKNYNDIILMNLSLNQEEHKEIPFENLRKNVDCFQTNSFEKVFNNMKNELSVMLSKIKVIIKGCSLCGAENSKLKNCLECKMMICENCLGRRCEECQSELCKNCEKSCEKCESMLLCQKCDKKLSCSKCKSGIKCEKCEYECSKCKLCMKCLEKCDKCQQNVCKQCHNCYDYTWANGSKIAERSVLEWNEISTMQPLPKGSFKVELLLQNFDVCCYGIGITEKAYVGKPDSNLSYLPGWNSNIHGEEYGIALCEHNIKNYNRQCEITYGRKFLNGKITLILDKSRKLYCEFDGISQGLLYDNIPERKWYLTFGADEGKGIITILSVSSL